MDCSIDTSLKQFQFNGNYYSADADSLLTVTYPQNNGFITSLQISKQDIYADESWFVYSKDGKALITFVKHDGYVKHEEPTYYKVKEGTKIICDYAFWACDIREIIIPDSVQAIGREAFWGCSSLSSVVLSNKIETIPENAFWGCRNLSYIKLPESLKRIEEKAFDFCDRLGFVFLAQNVDYIAPNTFDKDRVQPINIIVPNLTKDYYTKLFEGRKVEIQTIDEFNTYQKERKEKEKRWKRENMAETIITGISYLVLMGGFLYLLYLLINCVSF